MKQNNLINQYPAGSLRFYYKKTGFMPNLLLFLYLILICLPFVFIAIELINPNGFPAEEAPEQGELFFGVIALIIILYFMGKNVFARWAIYKDIIIIDEHNLIRINRYKKDLTIPWENIIGFDNTIVDPYARYLKLKQKPKLLKIESTIENFNQLSEIIETMTSQENGNQRHE